MMFECPLPKVDNKTSEWSLHDKDVLEQAKKQCRTFYGEDACVRKIEKTGENSYKVVCFDPKEST